MHNFSMSISSSDIGKVGESVFGKTTTSFPPIKIQRTEDMGKRKFQRLIKRASQPAPKEPGQSQPSGGYSEKQTHPRKTEGTSVKPRGKSRSKNASTGSKNSQ